MESALLEWAQVAFSRSYAPFSGGYAGCAVLVRAEAAKGASVKNEGSKCSYLSAEADGLRGRVWLGSSVDNSAFPSNLCAVVNGIFAAISDGAVRCADDIEAVAFHDRAGEAKVNKEVSVEQSRGHVEPCGKCCHLISMFSSFPFITRGSNNAFSSVPSKSLFPDQGLPIQPFDPPKLPLPEIKTLTGEDPPHISHEEIHTLAKAAVEICRNAAVCVFNFPVGAALLTQSGQIVAGANIQVFPAHFGACAEVNMISSAVSKGIVKIDRDNNSNIKMICVICLHGIGEFSYCCGQCRQNLNDFVKDTPILSLKPTGNGHFQYKIIPFTELLPFAFHLSPNTK